MSSKIKDIQLDDAVKLNADYKFNPPDRRKIDDQILGVQSHLIDSLLSGVHATWLTVDGGSPTLAVGDCVCTTSTSGVLYVTKATTVPLNNAKSALGVCLSAGAPGSKVRVAIAGVVSASITGLAINSPGSARVNPVTARCEFVSSPSANDYIIGSIDKTGTLTVTPLGSGLVGVGAGVLNVSPVLFTGQKSTFASGTPVPIDTVVAQFVSSNSTEFLTNAQITQVDGSSSKYCLQIVCSDLANGDTYSADYAGTFSRTGVSTPVVVGSLPSPTNISASGAFATTPPSARIAGISGGVGVYFTGVGTKNIYGSAAFQGQHSLRTITTAPIISSFAPSSVVLAGASITITGSNFASGIKISIDGAAYVDVTTYTNSNTITHSFPAHGAATVNVIVKNLDGQTSNTATIAYSSTPAPTISNDSPNHGGSGSTTAIVITGTNLTGTSGVTINGVACTSIVNVNSTTVNCTTPTGSVGAQTLILTNPGGTATSTYTYDASSFDASTVYGANLTHWSRDDSFTVVSNRCTVMVDKSANSKSFEQTTANFQALYTAADVNGHGDLTMGPTAGLSGNPTRYGEATAITLANLINTGTAFNVTLVMRPHAAAHNDGTTALNGDGVVADVGLYWGLCLHNRGSAGNLTLVSTIYHAGYHNTPDALVSVDNWHVVGVRYDGTNLFVNVDGTETTGVATGAPDVLTGTVKVGWAGVTGRYADFKLAELVFAKADLGPSSYNSQVVTPLKTKYGIP